MKTIIKTQDRKNKQAKLSFVSAPKLSFLLNRKWWFKEKKAFFKSPWSLYRLMSLFFLALTLKMWGRFFPAKNWIILLCQQQLQWVRTSAYSLLVEMCTLAPPLTRNQLKLNISVLLYSLLSSTKSFRWREAMYKKKNWFELIKLKASHQTEISQTST